MKVYGDLIVTGAEDALRHFIGSLENSLAGGWRRNRQREAEVSRAALGPMYCFACAPHATRPACELWMATNSEGHLHVSNILGQGFSSLTYDQYNAILLDFYSNCVEPAAKGLPVTVQLGDFNRDIEKSLSPSAVSLLRSFSGLANRTVLHPNDRRRWNEFLASAHRERAELDAGMLQRWLIEEEKWPEDQAIKLATEYEDARNLLATYESWPA